jgi:hypothetical protein
VPFAHAQFRIIRKSNCDCTIYGSECLAGNMNAMVLQMVQIQSVV